MSAERIVGSKSRSQRQGDFNHDLDDGRPSQPCETLRKAVQQDLVEGHVYRIRNLQLSALFQTGVRAPLLTEQIPHVAAVLAQQRLTQNFAAPERSHERVRTCVGLQLYRV